VRASKTVVKKLWDFLTREDVYWRLFSLVLAIILWLLAVGGGSLGQMERTLDIDVEVRNLPGDLVLVEYPEEITVRVRGLSPILNRGESSISAFIDLTGAQEGTETYNVEVTSPLGIEVLDVTPGWVSVYTEGLEEAVFPVTLALLGVDRAQLAAGLRPEPPIVTVRAARSALEQVDHVVAYVNIGASIESGSAFPVRALDAQGRGVAVLDIEPAEIAVEVDQEEPEEIGEE
jgi:YbbR domain-containing protein